jgi:hypothetical protein
MTLVLDDRNCGGPYTTLLYPFLENMRILNIRYEINVYFTYNAQCYIIYKCICSFILEYKFWCGHHTIFRTTDLTNLFLENI